MRIGIETEPIFVRCLNKQPSLVEIISLFDEQMNLPARRSQCSMEIFSIDRDHLTSFHRTSNIDIDRAMRRAMPSSHLLFVECIDEDFLADHER